MTSSVTDATCDDSLPNTAVVHLGREYGSIGFEAIAELERDLFREIETTGTSLLIDLSRTDYIGCRFLTALIRCSVQAAQQNVRIVLCAINPQPADVFEVTGLQSLWEVYSTDHEAIEAQQQQPAAERSGHVWARSDE